MGFEEKLYYLNGSNSNKYLKYYPTKYLEWGVMKNIKYFRKVWGNTKPHKLKLKKRPPLDTRDGKLKSKEERFENVNLM